MNPRPDGERGIIRAPAFWNTGGLPALSAAPGRFGHPPDSLAPRASPKAAAPPRSAAAVQNLAENGPFTLASSLALTLALLTSPALAETLSGGSFTLEGGPVAGGGPAGGDPFGLDGSAGETATGALAGGTFEVTGGLLGMAVGPGEVALDFTATDSQITLTWPADAAGYGLEFTPVIGDAANWQPVTPTPPANTYATPFNPPLRFFRLHKP